jgi:hypothetical protein
MIGAECKSTQKSPDSSTLLDFRSLGTGGRSVMFWRADAVGEIYQDGIARRLQKLPPALLTSCLGAYV